MAKVSGQTKKATASKYKAEVRAGLRGAVRASAATSTGGGSH